MQVVILPIAIGKMTANFSTHVFSPQHCGCDRLTSIDDVRQCLTEYIYWSSYAYRNRQCAGQLYDTLLSFKDDAESVFIDVRELVKNMPWDNVKDCTEIIRCYIPDEQKPSERFRPSLDFVHMLLLTGEVKTIPLVTV